MALSVYLRDNLNAFSFNMLVVSALDVFTFVVLFFLVIPLPEMFRTRYAYYVNQCTVGFLFFMMFCMYQLLSTVFKMIRNINVYHSTSGELKKVDPRSFYKRIAKNQRDILLCIIGCIFATFALLLAVQVKRPSSEAKVEDEKVKSAEEKKND